MKNKQKDGAITADKENALERAEDDFDNNFEKMMSLYKYMKEQVRLGNEAGKNKAN